MRGSYSCLVSSMYSFSCWYGHSYSRWLLTQAKFQFFGVSILVIQRTSVVVIAWCVIFSSQRDAITVLLAIGVFLIWTIIVRGSTIASASGTGNFSFFCWSMYLSSLTTLGYQWVMLGLRVFSGLWMFTTIQQKPRMRRSWSTTSWFRLLTCSMVLLVSLWQCFWGCISDWHYQTRQQLKT